MFPIQLFGTVESYDDASYSRDVEQADGSITQEPVQQWTLTLAVSGMRDLVKVNIGKDFGVATQKAQQWEDAGNVLVKVFADKYTLTTGIRNKKAWGVISFHAMAMPVEASADEIKALATARKQVKAAQKAARAAKKVQQQKKAS
jgi:hypothetical protein